MSDILHDQPARDRIRTAFDAALFVEAGAGTGKTTELVQRIAGIVEAGRAELHEIAAITFTEAAAGELRERVRSKLEQRLTELSGERAKRVQDALRQVEDAPMQTIHGFANRLLQAYPTEVGLPPVFNVRDATESSLAFDAEWRSSARRLFVASDEHDATHARLLQLAWMLGADLRRLRALARAFHEHAHELGPVEAPDADFVWLPRVADVVERVDTVLALQHHCGVDDDKMFILLRDLACPWRDALAAAIAAGDELTAVETLRSGLGKLRVGQAKNWPSGMLDQIRDLCEEVESVRQAVLELPRKWVMQGLIALMAQLAKQSEARRIRDGALEFGDLLVLADRLVATPQLRQHIQQRFRFIFVDEFQDTDPLQTRLVSNLVARADDAGNGDQVEPAAGRLFTVGDPKQSIYRFRNADLEQYLAVREAYSHAVAHLTTNFRTLPAILDWVDAVFEPLMRSSLGQWSGLHAGRSAEHAGTVQVFGDRAPDGMLSAHVREVETAELAERLNSARDRGWLVHGRDGALRPIRFGDMAVLLPTRRSLPNLERAFRQARIPYRVESRSLIWSTQEIRDVLSVLRVLDDAQNENSVIASLRSPAFGCADDELAQWRADGGTWRVGAYDGDDRLVARSLSALHHMRERSRFSTVPAIVEMVIEERKLFHAAFGHLRQREPWNRLRFIADQAQAWHDNGGAGLHEFIRWVDENDDMQATMLESVVPESDDDAVRVMTIHAAKGLEFPLAAVIGLGSVPSSTDSVRVLWPKKGGAPEVRIGNKDEKWQTPAFQAAFDIDVEQEAHERIRLLYVAVTRARDHLLIGLHRGANERQPKSMASLLAAACESASAGGDAGNAPPMCATPSLSQGASGVMFDDDPAAILREAAERRSTVVSTAARHSLFSASRIAALVSEADAVLPVRVAGPQTDNDDLGYRLTFGSAVHKALESVDFDADDAEVARVVSLVAIEFGLEGHEPLMTQAVKKALRSQPVREAVASGRSWREVTVSKELDGLIIRGSIDLLYERDGQLVVVDYKTEAVPDESTLQHAIDRYRYQLYTYAAALEQQGVGEVVEVALLFIPPGEGEATWVAMPAEPAVEALRRAIATL
jgi:ATP-dependent exoDNAse (exonuclease V) beta subunit